MTSTLDGIAVVSALAIYRRETLPRARARLREAEREASAIPEAPLREAALTALREKGRNVEATAVFAALAPRPHRVPALRAITTLQIAVDYLDTLGERPVDGALASGLLLHRALAEAVSPGAVHSDWYRLYPYGDDGGYLESLVAACQSEVAKLPASAAVAPVAARAARRCAEGQCHTHATCRAEGEGLKSWVDGLGGPAGYAWWELAAGASSSVAIHASIAAAADSGTGRYEAELVDAAYFPSVGALTVLLDDLVDEEEDRLAGEHNYLSYYPSRDEAASRMGFIARRAGEAIAELRRRRRHAAILAGVAGFYLSAPAARNGLTQPLRGSLLDSVGTAVYPVLGAMRVLGRG